FTANLSASTTTASATALNVAGLTPNTTYFFRLGSLNQAGAANYVALPSSMTLAAIPSSAPFSAVANASLVANWGANGNPSVTSYTVDLSTNGFSTVLASTSTTSVSAQFTGLS